MTDRQMQEIAHQVRLLIDRKVAAGEPIKADWIVTEVVTSWSPPGGVDADKWTKSGYACVRDIVRKEVQRYKPKDEDDADPQLLLDGHKKLHRAYLINRNGEQTIVRTDQLTVEEALSIYEELRRNVRGLELHQHELLRYIDNVLIPNQAKNNAG
jgi:hypothetical protein